MWTFLRELWRMLKSREGRNELAFAMFRHLPGKPGFLARGHFLRNALGSAGPGLMVYEGVQIRNSRLVNVGANVHIGEQCFLQAGGGLVLGDDVMIGPGVKIWTQNHRFDDLDVPIRDQGAEYKAVEVGPDCWLGANCFIMPGTTLGRGCVVSAGAVVGAKNYPDHCILMGNPARVIGSRVPKPAAD